MDNGLLTSYRKGRNKKEIRWEVDGNGCWNCTSHRPNKGGYPQYTILGNSETLHRRMYRNYVGEIGDGLCVCHKCDNRMCINPDHLFVGTKKDNNDDRRNKGRNANFKGIKNPKAKLTEPQVIEIRNMTGITHSKIAKLYNITKGHVTNIRRLYNWKCIKENKDAR